MKYILSILFSLVCYCSFGQFVNTTQQGSATTLINSKGGTSSDSSVSVLSKHSFTDTTSANFSVISKYKGTIIYTTGDAQYWIRRLLPYPIWDKFNTSAASLVSITQGYGIIATPNPITTVGTIAVNPSILADSNYWRTVTSSVITTKGAVQNISLVGSATASAGYFDSTNGYVRVNRATTGKFLYYIPTSNTDAARGIALQNAFDNSSTGDVFYIGTGNYFVTNVLTLRDSQAVYLNSARIYHTNSSIDMFTIGTKNNVSISGKGVLEGSGTVGLPITSEVGIRIGEAGTTTAIQSGISIYGITIKKFGGAGILLNSEPSPVLDSAVFKNGMVSNVEIESCTRGVKSMTGYWTLDQLNITDCDTGFLMASPNLVLSNSNINENRIAIYTSVGADHSIISNNNINHNSIRALDINQASVGVTIIGNHIFAAYPSGGDTTIRITSSKGVAINGGIIGQGVVIQLSGTTPGYNSIKDVGFVSSSPTLIGTTLQKNFLKIEQNYVLDSVSSYINTAIVTQDGGTGKKSWTPYAIVTGGTVQPDSLQQVSSLGDSGQFLKSNGAGSLPSWATAITPSDTSAMLSGYARTGNLPSQYWNRSSTNLIPVTTGDNVVVSDGTFFSHLNSNGTIQTGTSLTNTSLGTNKLTYIQNTSLQLDLLPRNLTSGTKNVYIQNKNYTLADSADVAAISFWKDSSGYLAPASGYGGRSIFTTGNINANQGIFNGNLSSSTYVGSSSGSFVGNFGVGVVNPDVIGYGTNGIFGIKGTGSNSAVEQNGIAGTGGNTTDNLYDLNAYGMNGTGSVVARVLIRAKLDGATNSAKWEFYTMNAGSAAKTMDLDKNGILTITNLGTGAVQATAGVLSVVSDSHVKNIDTSRKYSASNMIMKIPKSAFAYWNYNSKSKLPLSAQKVKQYGLLADKVHEALGEEFAPTQPQSKEDSTTNTQYYGLSDRALLSLSIQAQQEQQKKIESLEQRISKLEKLLNLTAQKKK